MSRLSRLAPPKEVCDLLGVSLSTLQRMRRRGGFPKPVQISPNRIGWPIDIIDSWMRDPKREASKGASTDNRRHLNPPSPSGETTPSRSQKRAPPAELEAWFCETLLPRYPKNVRRPTVEEIWTAAREEVSPYTRRIQVRELVAKYRPKWCKKGRRKNPPSA
jgi:prophage regulatory protein